MGICELTSEQIETLCSTAEDRARKYILSRVPSKMVEKLNISVEAEGAKPVTLTVEIDVVLSPQMKNFNAQKLVDEALKNAFEYSEDYLRKLT
jgi:hypothetical protein